MSDESTGIVLEWEKQAIRGDEMPNGLSYPHQVLYQALSYLYARYQGKYITRERAVQEKKKLLEEFRVYEYREKMGEQWVQVIKDTDLARAEYKKNRTLENADTLVAIIEGRRLGA